MQNIDELGESIGRQVSELSLVTELVPRAETKRETSDDGTDSAVTVDSLASEVSSLFAVTGVTSRSKWRRWKTQEEIADEIARWIQRSRDAAAQERAELLASL